MDRFNWSRKLLVVLLAVTVFGWVFPVLYFHSQPVDDHTGVVIRLLNLSNLSITASGHPLRHPEGVIPSVNLNFSPYFSPFSVGLEYLLLAPPKNPKEHAAP